MGPWKSITSIDQLVPFVGMIFSWNKQVLQTNERKNKMKPTNPNAHTYVNGTDVKTHGYAVTHNTFLQKFIWTVLYMFPLLPVCSVEWKV